MLALPRRLLWEEVELMAGTALQAAGTPTLSALMLLVDLCFVGQALGPDSLAAAALGNAYWNVLWHFIHGVSGALDELAAEAHSAGDSGAVRRLAIAAATVLLALCVPFAGLLLLAGLVVEGVLGQPARVAAMVGLFCSRLAPGLPCAALFSGLQKLQQSQSRPLPGMVVGAVGNLCNIGLKWLFVVHCGWGLAGSATATSVSRAAQLVLLAVLELRHLIVQRKQRASEARLLRRSMTANSSGTLAGDVSELDRFVELGLPAGLRAGLSSWPVELLTLAAGYIGLTALGAHAALASLCSVGFLALPSGLAAALACRVAAGLVSHDARRAVAAVTAALLLGVGFASAAAVALYLARASVGTLFTFDAAVGSSVSALATTAALVLALGGVQGVAAGAFRGLGRHNVVVAVDLLAFWALALPVGATLAIPLEFGLAAIWWGLGAGQLAACLAYLAALSCLDWQQAAHDALLRTTINDGMQHSRSDEHLVDRSKLDPSRSPPRFGALLRSTSLPPSLPPVFASVSDYYPAP